MPRADNKNSNSEFDQADMEDVGDFSKVLQSVGGMGWWQTRNLILSSIRSSIHYKCGQNKSKQ